MTLSFAQPTRATSLTSAVRQLTGADEKVKAAETELDSARAALDTFRATSSHEALRQRAGSRMMSAHGIWILCLPPIAGMYLAGNMGLGLPAFVAGLAAPVVGFWLMGRAAKRQAAEQYAQLAPQEHGLMQRLAQAELRYRDALAVNDKVVTGITQDDKKVVVNGVPLKRREKSA